MAYFSLLILYVRSTHKAEKIPKEESMVTVSLLHLYVQHAKLSKLNPLFGTLTYNTFKYSLFVSRRKRKSFSSTMRISSKKINSILFRLFVITVIIAVSVSGVVVMADVSEDDVRCLQGLKNKLNDPQGKLKSWTFSNPSVGFICKFTGASCWNERENRMISLELPSFDLAGKIPDSLQYCKSIQILDISGNAISGTIPSQICDWLPYLVRLDLSHNDLSGPIPPELVKCKFLNSVMLGNIRLSGPIPYELASLNRLKKFSVANNNLTGQIPSFMSNFDRADFIGNSGLCGRPLRSKCGGVKN